MLPYIEIGTMQISTYWLVYSIAILVGATLSFHRLFQRGTRPDLVSTGLLISVIGGFAGAFLLRGLFSIWQNIANSGQLSWGGGSNILGAVAGGSWAGFYYCHRHSVPIGRSFDLGGISLPLAQAIGRLGCLARGCCYGKVSTSIFTLYLPDSQGHWDHRYPTQIISSIANFLIFLILLGFERSQIRRGRESWPFPGFLFLLYIELIFQTLSVGIPARGCDTLDGFVLYWPIDHRDCIYPHSWGDVLESKTYTNVALT